MPRMIAQIGSRRREISEPIVADPRLAGRDRKHCRLASLRGHAAWRLDRAEIFRRLATVEHAVVSDDANLPVPHLLGTHGVNRLPSLPGVRIPPEAQKQELAR